MDAPRRSVNRRVGGLEDIWLKLRHYRRVNRRVGGLEANAWTTGAKRFVNRRVGGLEDLRGSE